MAIELAPSLAVLIFGVLSTGELVEAVPTAVGIALAVPEEFVAVAAPAVVVSIVAEHQQHAWSGLCDRCERGARCITQAGLAMQR